MDVHVGVVLVSVILGTITDLVVVVLAGFVIKRWSLRTSSSSSLSTLSLPRASSSSADIVVFNVLSVSPSRPRRRRPNQKVNLVDLVVHVDVAANIVVLADLVVVVLIKS